MCLSPPVVVLNTPDSSRLDRGFLHELHQHARAGRALRFFHDVLHVRFYRGLRDTKSTGDFFVGPPFGQILDDVLLTVRELETFFALVRYLLAAPHRF